MTLSLPSGKAINLAAVTYAERASWRVSQDNGRIQSFDGVIVHFIGGTRLRLTGTDAAKAAQEFGL